jgi:hypothetical protein
LPKTTKTITEKFNAMKTKIYTMIVLLAFNASIVFAGGIKSYTVKSETSKTETTIDLAKLAPALPKYAEFTDGTGFKAGAVAPVSKLSPVTPKEAEFEDSSELNTINIYQLAPIPPKETNFEEIDEVLANTHPLSPTTPGEADFTD